MNYSEKKHITVLGGGIVGICCALKILRSGCSVVLLDRAAPGEGCSRGNAGVLATGSFVPNSLPGVYKSLPRMLLDPLGPVSMRWRDFPIFIPWFKEFLSKAKMSEAHKISQALATLTLNAYDDHLQIAQGTNAEKYLEQRMFLSVYEGCSAFKKDELAWELKRIYGAKVVEYFGSEIFEIEPELSPRFSHMRGVAGAGVCRDPEAYVKALWRTFEREGGTYKKCFVKDIDFDASGPRRLIFDGGEMNISNLVIAMGANSAYFAKLLGCYVPLISERGYHVMLPTPNVKLTNPVLIERGKFVMTSMEGGMRLAGTSEFAKSDAPANWNRAKAILKLGQHALPNLNSSNSEEWMGERPSLPDSLPVIGQSPVYQNVFFAFGHQHVGLTSAPKTGEIIADLILGRIPNRDLSSFRADRFKL